MMLSAADVLPASEVTRSEATIGAMCCELSPAADGRHAQNIKRLAWLP